MSKIGRSGRSTILCQQFGLECQRLEEVEEVKEVEKWKKWKKYDLLPAIWA